MPWLRLDDQMGEHRKIKRALKSSRASIALHTLALLHCARYLTDGAVETAFVDDICEDARIPSRERKGALHALETHELWCQVDGGWQIHDYLKYNPSRADVEAKRDADARRKAEGRNRAAERRLSARTPDGLRADSARSPVGVQEESARPGPARPGPYPPSPPEGGSVDVPVRPTSGRARDKDAYESEVRDFAETHFQHLPERERFFAVRGALNSLKPPDPTFEEVCAWIAEWGPAAADSAKASAGVNGSSAQ